ncbi:MAG: DUF4395 domain-containing protein [Bacillus sp. (in: firmicutes)]
MDNTNTLTVPQPLVRLNNWLTIGLILLAWVLQSSWLILIPVVYFGMGALLGKNPVILLGKQILPKDRTYIMEDREQLKFNSWLAFLMLLAALIFLYSGLGLAYSVFTGMCAAANLGAAFGYCAGCFIRFQWKQYRYRRAIR